MDLYLSHICVFIYITLTYMSDHVLTTTGLAHVKTIVLETG